MLQRNVVIGLYLQFTDLIELQKSCMGCMGNLANLERNRQTLIDKKCGQRILEVLARSGIAPMRLCECVYSI